MDTENNVSSENTVTSKNPSVKTDENKNCCGICLTVYKSPRILPCKHIFCRLCLIKLADKKQDPLSCPLCREEINLSNCEVDKLPMYFEEDDDEDEDDEGHTGDEDDNEDAGNDCNSGDEDVNDGEIHRDLCVVCENSVPAEYECFQCQKFLCGSCKKDHDKWLKHDVQDLKLDLSQDKCLKHPEVKLGYFCMDCGRILCKECVKSEHSLHQTQTLKSYLTEIDGELEDYSSDIEEKLETVEMSKVKFSSKIETTVLSYIENVKILGEDFKIELEKACQSEDDNQLKDKTLLNRINFMGKRIKKSKRQRKFNQNLISEIKELQAKITTHKTFYLPNDVDDIINNQIGMMDIQIGRLFAFQIKEKGNCEFNFFFGNITWTLSVKLMVAANGRLITVLLTPFTKHKDTMFVESITIAGKFYVEGGVKYEMISKSFGKKFQSNKDQVTWQHHLTEKSDFSVKVLFEKCNIIYRTQVD